MRVFFALLCLGPLLRAQNLIEHYRFTDIRNNRVLDMPVVNAAQVEGYEILYATPGTGDIAEIAGHLLLRIQLKDVPEDQDLVISFLADTGTLPNLGIQDPTLSECRNRNWLNLLQTPDSDHTHPWDSISQSLRGLSGGFPVTMDIQTLAYTLKSYTVEQDRNLLRYRLILSDAQRDQLTHTLIAFKDRPPLPYYFFHQNCGSVLVRVVGEGIGVASVANFRPWVSPPHSLCALLIREGIAERVRPDFHSTRTRGDLYREWFRFHYPQWTAETAELPWPAMEDFLSADVNTRVRAIQQLEGVIRADPDQISRLLALGPLLQQMELATDVRSGLCRDLTSQATTAARELQAVLMQAFPDQPPENLYPGRHPLDPHPPAYPTSLHTGLFAWETGAGWLDQQAVWMVSGALLQQQMGARSALAMQRAGEITLGRAALIFNAEELHEWQITGLSLKKFRERRGRVSSGLISPQGWGMGLKVLEVQKRSIPPDIQGSVAGISGWMNLLSSASNRHYIIAGAGLDTGWSQHRSHGTDWGGYLPLQAESLLSAGALQWRNRFAWIPNRITDRPIDSTFSSDLAYPLGEWGKTEVILHARADRVWSGTAERTLGMLTLEFKRW